MLSHITGSSLEIDLLSEGQSCLEIVVIIGRAKMGIIKVARG